METFRKPKLVITSNYTLYDQLNRIGNCSLKNGLLYWNNRLIRKIDIDGVNLGGDTRIILKGSRGYIKVDAFEIKCITHPLDVTRLNQLEKDKVKKYKFTTNRRQVYLNSITKRISNILNGFA